MSDDDILERGGTQEDIDAYAHDVGGACGAVYGGSCDYCGKVTSTEQDKELDEILDYFLTDIYMNNEHFAANQEALDKTKEEPMQAILDWHKKIELQARLDPFDFVEPCEPDCDDVRHAYHQGQWDMATRIKAQQEEV